MKIEELRLLIREELREVMREELREILTEAVQIASTPSQEEAAPAHKLHLSEPAWVAELKGTGEKKQVVNEGVKSPMDMLAATAKSMTREDISNFS